MTNKMRQMVEREIAEQLIKDALAAGYTLGVNDGEEITLRHCGSAEMVLKAMFTTDEDYLLVYDNEDASHFGWVRFVYGNDGYDVISDYSTNLEHIMAGANKISDKYAD